MGFFQSSFRARLPVRTRAPIFAVGWRAYVASPVGAPARLALSDEAGADANGVSMADGTEVEIVAWRPRSNGTRYRVRSTRAGLEGWLAAGSLRRSVSSSAANPPPNAARLPTPQRAASTLRIGKPRV